MAWSWGINIIAIIIFKNTASNDNIGFSCEWKPGLWKIQLHLIKIIDTLNTTGIHFSLFFLLDEFFSQCSRRNQYIKSQTKASKKSARRSTPAKEDFLITSGHAVCVHSFSLSSIIVMLIICARRHIYFASSNSFQDSPNKIPKPAPERRSSRRKVPIAITEDLDSTVCTSTIVMQNSPSNTINYSGPSFQRRWKEWEQGEIDWRARREARERGHAIVGSRKVAEW